MAQAPHPVQVFVYPEKISNSPPPLQHMEFVIREVAAECSSFVHHVVRISDTAESCLRLETDSFVTEMLNDMGVLEKEKYLNNIKARIETIRDDMIKHFYEQRALKVPRHEALM
jgi:hypothetical protein